MMEHPNKIAIVGFADSKDEAPFDDDSWEIWGVNDLYHHVKRVTRSFELHNLVGLGNRRNPGYEQWLKDGKVPTYMWAADCKPEFPSVIPFPQAEVMAAFGSYFTNSIAWMTAFALLLLCKVDENGVMTAREDTHLGLWGVDMAHETEYGTQRPSCEYYIGIGRALGVEVYVPPTSDLLKCSSLYGIETTQPQRIKMMKRISTLQSQHDQLQAQENQLQMQIQALQASRNQIKGAIGMAKYTIGVWTMPTDNTDKTDKVRGLTPKSDGIEIVTNGGPIGLDIEALMKQSEVLEVGSPNG